MKKLILSLSTCFALLFGTSSCEPLSCTTATSIVDLLYTSAELLVASFVPGPGGGIILQLGEQMDLKRKIQNKVTAQVDDCNLGVTGKFSEETVLFYRPDAQSEWEKIPNSNQVATIAGLNPNQDVILTNAIVAETPGCYGVGRSKVDDQEQVIETIETNNVLDKVTVKLRTLDESPVSSLTFEVIDPTGKLKPVNDVRLVKCTVSKTRIEY